MATRKTKKPSSARGTFRRSSQYLQAVIDSLDDELMVVDRDLRITQVNAALLRRVRAGRQDVIGQFCYEVSHGVVAPCVPPDCECTVKKVWETGKLVRLTHYHHGAEDDEEKCVDIIASPVRDSQGNTIEVVELLRDVTEARRLEQQIIAANQELLALNAIAGTVAQSLDLDTILNSAFDKVLELMKASTGGILLLDEESQTLCYRIHRGLSEEFVHGVASLRLGEGIAGRVAQSGEAIYVEDISQDPRLTRPVVITEGLRAFASVPLQSKNRVMGVMNIASHTQRQFTAGDIRLLNIIGNQIAIAIENAGLYQEVQRKEAARGELLREVISIQEEERKRISRGLHDETSQALTSLAVGLEAALAALPPGANGVKAKLREMQSLAINTLDEIHRVIYELRPTLLDDLGLIAAVKWYAEGHLEAAGIKMYLETAGQERTLPPHVETAVFRIVQEAITNIVRHAGAESTSISLEFRERSIGVYIEDDGIGFDLDEVMSSADRRRELGLLGMKERVELLGGSLSLRSRPGLGTQVAVEIPLEREGAHE
ncbi:MAG: GAF domain-containing protein [Dehalococcoidia bacterium]